MMRLIIVVFILFFNNVLWAQPSSGTELTATERNELRNSLTEAEIKAKANEALSQVSPPAAPPVAAPALAPAPATPVPEPTPAPAPVPPPIPMPAPAVESSQVSKPVMTGDKKNMSFTQANAENRNKSPFMIPNELYLKFKQNEVVTKAVVNENAIDNQAEVRLRWPLRDYILVGVIWNVKKPKAFIQDKAGKVHAFHIKDYIGNGQGYVAEINNGEVIVVERGAEVKLKLQSGL